MISVNYCKTDSSVWHRLTAMCQKETHITQAPLQDIWNTEVVRKKGDLYYFDYFRQAVLMWTRMTGHFPVQTQKNQKNPTSIQSDCKPKNIRKMNVTKPSEKRIRLSNSCKTRRDTFNIKNISLTVIIHSLCCNLRIDRGWADQSLLSDDTTDDSLRHTDNSKECWKDSVFKVSNAHTVHISSYLWMGFPVQPHRKHQQWTSPLTLWNVTSNCLWRCTVYK